MRAENAGNLEKKRKDGGIVIWNIIGTVLCVLLLPIVAVNITLIAKSYLNRDEVPSIGGYMPLIVLSDSMYPDIKSGDLIICRKTDPETVSVGDVIAFFDPQGNGSTIVTHQVIAVVTEGASLKFQTKGVANNAEDPVPVPAENLVGTYRTKIAGVGNIAMFMQTTTGLILCVVVPVLLIVLYSFIRQRMYENSRKKETEELLAELEALRAEKSGRKEDEKDVS